MMFAVFGVPITMICLAYLGTLLAQGFQSAYTSILPGISAETLSPLTDKIECKSHSSQKTQPLEIEDSAEDLRGSSEISYSRERLRKGQRHEAISKPARRSNSMMLATMNFALDDLSENVSTASERHSLLVECEMCAVEQNSVNSTSMRTCEDVEDSSEANIPERELKKSMKDCDNAADIQCSQEDRCSNCDSQAKEWKSDQPNTPSRVPLIDNDIIQPPHCLRHTMTGTKYLWNTSFSIKPSVPASTKCSSRRGQCTKYDQDSSPFAGSDRNLCSTPPSAVTTMDRASSNLAKLPFWVIFGVLGTYICIGAAIFASLGGWAYIDSSFFCFMLLSTVGFGDIVPGYLSKASTLQQKSRISTTELPVAFTNTEVSQPWILMSCCLYLTFGIILVSSFIVVAQKRWITFIHTVRARLLVFDNDLMDGEDHNEEIVPQEGAIELSFNQLF